MPCYLIRLSFGLLLPNGAVDEPREAEARSNDY